jgi:hypothetical protein
VGSPRGLTLTLVGVAAIVLGSNVGGSPAAQAALIGGGIVVAVAGFLLNLRRGYGGSREADRPIRGDDLGHHGGSGHPHHGGAFTSSEGGHHHGGFGGDGGWFDGGGAGAGGDAGFDGDGGGGGSDGGGGGP